MHQDIRLPVDVIHTAPRLSSVRNRRMGQQLNRRHGAINHTFSLGQLVHAKNYRDGVEKWIAGHTLRGTGLATYDVEVQSSLWVSHANQLCPSFQPVTVPSSQVIPLDILLDTFNLHQNVSVAAPNPEAHPLSICTPRRWTDRSRRQVVHMQPNLRQ
ncbi:hypothetical protein PHET_11296 [Paragonimus heterotremus]|uniref:Uncharacterized protein n=1 Tax=Paragonimus heterotremus TaxID=100268 RepID=A0A8J4WMG6_9TREM|nr:hypothetical protein PHET_11296 [Paragonimus heterotremus]